MPTARQQRFMEFFGLLSGERGRLVLASCSTILMKAGLQISAVGFWIARSTSVTDH